MTAYTKFARALQRTDPALYDLPHPKIAKLSDVIGLLNLIVGDSGVTILSDILKDLTKTKGVLIIAAARAFPSIAKLKNFSHGDGKVYMPGLEGFLAPLRFFVNDGRIFEVETELDRLLAWTDIGSSAPIDFFRMPFRVTYFHFGSNAGDLELTTENFESSPLLGAYVTELHLLETTPESKHFSRWAGPDGEITCYEITLVGRPIPQYGRPSGCLRARACGAEDVRDDSDHQPFGPGRAQSKLLWIQPMLVGDLKEEDRPVKQYSVQIPRPKR